MADAGIGQQSAIGGYELAFGSKPSLHAITVLGRLTTDGGTDGSIFVDGDGLVTVTGTGKTATCPHGAGYLTFGAAAAGVIAGTWTIGTGAHIISVAAGMPDGEDDMEITMASGDFSTAAGAACVAAGTGALPGQCNITKIDGGTVTFALSCPHEDTDDLADGDGYRLTLMAWSKGGV